MKASSPPLRWGILGAARIAIKNWKAIRLSGNSIVRAVASRSQEKSQQFIDAQQAIAPFEVCPEALGSYEQLLAHPEIDAVYIPLPTSLRKTWVIRAAEAGKHVLAEKPCAVDAAELEEMLAACRRHGVRFMDGVMFMHHPRLERVRPLLEDAEKVGHLRRMHTSFSFRAAEGFLDSNIRAQAELEPLGCLGDLGWYCIRFALWLRNGELPLSAKGKIHQEVVGPDGQPGSPLEFSGELEYADGFSCGFYCSFFAHQQQWVVISGEHAALRIPDFVNPADDNDVAWELGYERTMKDTTGLELGWTTRPESQETRMFRHFAQGIGSPPGESENFALQTQRILDACLRSARNGSRPFGVAS
ncbi:putative dehydrogenase [Haloferula luteola]|uniref:Putative dehydrogenase n=1 Tax=Haloferula luteola TaxID=595692 RepID=A0A840V7P5_9BACT|nr:Gfo/Idh/MocA family oxidoreductase [Haloferula luteola]MBB5353066.1 putative dehydrogenase [Haloferula luteola]